MELILEESQIKEIGIKNLRKYQVNESQSHWHNKVTIHLIDFDKRAIAELREIIQNTTDKKQKTKAITIIDDHLKMIDNPYSKIKTVEMGVPAMIGYVGMSEGYRVYVQNPNNKKNYAYRVVGIHYEPPTNYDRQHVVLGLTYDQFGERRRHSISFYSEDLRGMNIAEAFDRKYIFIENKTHREIYHKEKRVFEETYQNIGMQYILNGVTTDDIPDEHSNHARNKFDSVNHRVVIDIFSEKDDDYAESKTHHRKEKDDAGLTFWKKHGKRFPCFLESNKQEKFNKQIEIPVHSDLIIFDLKRHMRLVCHTDFLTPYEYLTDLEDSLVIPAPNKDLIKSLINHGNGEFDDIVRDKSGGLLAMLTGPPGVGKTLTAEVFAEIQRKPLYAVQSSQLGVEPEKIEKELKRCFARSNRWGAILLIDEADVYVHKRTTDLKQNSVVGTFLRVLEYHPGILFMTSNRADIIDDAIISRCIVLIKYAQPSQEEQKEIWKVLATSLQCVIDEDSIDKITAEFCELSGRDIKNILKLCKISHGTKPITTDSVKRLAPFIPRFKMDEN